MNKAIYIFTIALLLFNAGCYQESSGYLSEEGCDEIGCVTITIEHPIQANKPIKVRISIRLKQIKDSLHILLLSENLKSIQFDIPPEATEVYRTEINVGWEIVRAELNKDYIFEGTIVLNEPSDILGISTYGIGLLAGFSEGLPIYTNAKLYLDADGNQVSTTPTHEVPIEQAVPFETGIIILPTNTAFPTVRIPTTTATHTLTPTLQAYPPSVENIGIVTPLPDYPAPG
ncbi:MAG: hypothetical protein C0396_03605, partial [Anaerolinea sp.]|nr:hypothetical protein [Anaerolinea sp.]